MQTITIAGRIGKDATRGTTQGGDVVANFSVAVDSRTGQDKATNWWRCSMWGKRADALGKYLTKGTSVALTGEFSLSEYDGKPQLNCRVSEIALMGGGEQRQDDKRDDSGPPKSKFADNLDDDIPF